MAKKLAQARRASARGTRVSVRAKSTAKPKAKPQANSRTKPLPETLACSLARPHGNRLVFSPELIADGKRRYETTPESLDSIALDFSTNRSTLRNIAKRENWVRYVPPPLGLSRAADIAAKAADLEAEALAPNPPSQRFGEASHSPPLAEPVIGPAQEGRTRWLAGGGEKSPAPPTALAWSMRARIDALRGAVDEEIAAVRALRASLKDVPHSTETAGRTSRTLADLTTTL